ncbi:MAG: TlpA family protein disulfide reductase [Solirubrobacteraceae bacterium]
MAQLSRPYQVALGAVLLFAVVWFVALNGHTSSSSSTPVAATPTPAAPGKTVTSSKIYHGAAPGVEGLTRDINRAHRSVAKTQGQEQKIAGAAAETKNQGSGASSSTTVVTKHGASGASATVVTKHVAAPAPHKTASSGIPPRQATIESELKRGEVAVVLFWSPKGADDKVVHGELQILLAAHHEVAVHPNKAQVRKLRQMTGLELEKKIAVHYASAGQVASFGTFTKTVQVYGTPTILVIDKQGAVTTINGLTDAFAIEQTIDEARQES